MTALPLTLCFFLYKKIGHNGEIGLPRECAVRPSAKTMVETDLQKNEQHTLKIHLLQAGRISVHRRNKRAGKRTGNQ
jgi:hypothetical protein